MHLTIEEENVYYLSYFKFLFIFYLTDRSNIRMVWHRNDPGFKEFFPALNI